MRPAWLDWPLIALACVCVLITAWFIRDEVKEHDGPGYFLMAVIGFFWFTLPQFELQAYYWPWFYFPWCVC